MQTVFEFRLLGRWKEAKDLTKKMARRAPKAADMAVHGAAMSYLRRVKKAFTSQGVGGAKWSPLSAITLALLKAGVKPGGGGTKALIRSGDMRKSVNVRKVEHGRYFVGVHRTDGMYNVARVHEQPLSKDKIFSIPVTPQMRRWFLYLFIEGIIPAPLKASTTHIVIKQRSFLRSVWDANKKGLRKLAAERYNSVLMTGKVGKAGRVR